MVPHLFPLSALASCWELQSIFFSTKHTQCQTVFPLVLRVIAVSVRRCSAPRVEAQVDLVRLRYAYVHIIFSLLLLTSPDVHVDYTVDLDLDLNISTNLRRRIVVHAVLIMFSLMDGHTCQQYVDQSNLTKKAETASSNYWSLDLQVAPSGTSNLLHNKY